MNVLLVSLTLMLAAPDAPGKWAPLFNGKDLSGWSDALDNASEWRVAGGVLEGRGGGRGRPAVLVSQRQDFADYRLRVVFSADTTAAAAVEVRHTGAGQNRSCYWVSAVVDGDPSTRPPGNVTKLSDYRYGDAFGPARRSRRVAAASGRWHTLVVTVTGGHIVTSVDGLPVDDYVDAKRAYASGGIALVCGGPYAVHVRSVDVQEIP